LSKLRIVYILSLALLGVLAGLAVVRPLVTGRDYSAVARESVLQEDDQWIIQFDIINQQDKDMNYNLVWSNGGETYTEGVLVGKGRVYSHIHHIYQDTIKEDKVNLTIYEEGETTPFEQLTYYLK
jgi:hypothetical protein